MVFLTVNMELTKRIERERERERCKLSFLGTFVFVASVFFIVPLAAQAALYLPGATLDPACAPTDPNCGISTIVASSTANSIPYYAANGSALSATSTFQILSNGTASTTNLIVVNSLTLGTLSGFLKAVAGAIATSLINLASDVTGILPVGNGGTGAATLSGILKGNGTGALTTAIPGVDYLPGTTVLVATTTSNLWAGTQTFTNPVVFGSGVGTSTFAGNIEMTGDIIPSLDDTYSLGSPTKQWKNIYVGAHSLFVNGQEVLSTDPSQNVNVSASVNQNLILQTSGSGNIELNPSGAGGLILFKNNVQLTAGMTIRTTNGTPLQFTDGIQAGNLALSANTLSVANVNGSLALSANGLGVIYTGVGNFGVGTSSPLSPFAVSGGASIGADYNLAAPQNGLIVEGKLGVGTSSPWRNFSLTGTVSSPQFALAYDATRYAQLQEDAAGDLSILTTGGNTRLPDNNLYVCAGGACPALTMLGTGNLAVENKITVGSIEQFCPTGYVWVPGEPRYGTLPGFCTMKYDASNSGGVPVSVPGNTPWVSITQTASRTACEALGTGYHLMSEPEWMTIADQIATLPINDLDAAAGLQLATGHSDNAPANALAAGTSATDPVVSGCTLMLPLSDASNAYVASSCELRGAGASGSTDADKGYWGTGNVWSASGYSAGGSNKSQLRTFVLPNGQVIWDMAGNVWQWTDAYIWSASAVGAASSTVSEMPDAGAWTASNWYQYTAMTNYKALAYARPRNPAWSSSNGIGQIYLQTDTGTYRAFVRGARWGSASGAGVFTLGLSFAPSDTSTSFGFRCSRYP